MEVLLEKSSLSLKNMIENLFEQDNNHFVHNNQDQDHNHDRPITLREHMNPIRIGAPSCLVFPSDASILI